MAFCSSVSFVRQDQAGHRPPVSLQAALQVPISVDSTSEVSGPPDRPPLTDTSSSVYHLPSAADKGSLAAGVLPPGEGRRPSLWCAWGSHTELSGEEQ